MKKIQKEIPQSYSKRGLLLMDNVDSHEKLFRN